MRTMDMSTDETASTCDGAPLRSHVTASSCGGGRDRSLSLVRAFIGVVSVFTLTNCAPPCVPFSRPAHDVSCDGDTLVASFNAQNSSVLSSSCAANVDGGVVVATVTGVVCPGEQFERLSSMLELDCTLPSLGSGTIPVHEGQVSLVSDGGVTVCRRP